MVQKASAYTFSSFDVPGAANPFGGTVGIAINSAGEVVGFFNDSNYNWQPFLEYNGTITTVEIPSGPGGILQGSGLYINNAGEVAGTYVNSVGGTDGFVENHGSVSTLAVPGGTNQFPGAVVDGINNSGEVLGAWLDSNFNEHDFVEKNGRFTNVSLPAGASLAFVPAAINDAGTIAGVLQNGQNSPQVFIDHAGKITTFDPTPQPATIYKLYINDTGEVAGTTGSGSFLYDKGTVTSIPGVQTVSGINNAGQVVGQYFLNGQEMGFVYSDGTFTSIDPPGSTFTETGGINDRGQITGVWFDSNNNGHGFVATPTGTVTSTTDLSTASGLAGKGPDNPSGSPLSKLLGSVPAADLLPQSRTTAPSDWAARLHFASGTALGALTYPDSSTVVMSDLHGGGH